ncbi:hypothetical protein TWF506_011368 [Arthrobotrys conoides]|uniref:AT hook domain-containing protein family protein n=1 Tax=Arthrobotrys conoides TaxID=74498 RepID=A0AAN8RS14_9PEZI
MATRRTTRSSSHKSTQLGTSPSVSQRASPLSLQSSIPLFPSSDLSVKFTGLSKRDLTLLLKKKRLLKSSTIQALATLDPHLSSAFLATLVFAQSEAGTALCISPTGLLLTCSHCVSEDPSELEENRIKWLLFASGRAIQAKCIAYDHTRDLALLQIISAEQEPTGTISNTSINHENPNLSFPSLPISQTPPRENAQIICVGHPGDEDLEASKPGVKTNYDVLHISSGRYRGIAEGADVHDNSEIGALMHDCWTYWGHSGAPLCLRKDGSVVGMHSSWDDETGMRRGVAWEGMVEFLRENGGLHVIEGVEERVAGSREAPILLE